MLSEENYKELVKYRMGAHVVGEDGLSKREMYLKQQGFIEVAEHRRISNSPSDIQIYAHSYKLTPSGEDALSEFEYIRNKKAADERQKRFSNKLAVLGIAVSLANFILGLLVEHFSGVVELIVSFLQR